MSYQIFIIKRHSSETEPALIQDAFLGVTGTFVYLTEPEARSNSGKKACMADTNIGDRCGKVGCTDCNGTHKMIPATPDYGIFDEIRNNHWDRTSGVIIVKSSTTSVSSADTIKYAIDKAVSNEGVEMFYFAKWLDRPDQFITLSKEMLTTGETFKIVRTWNAHGMQAVGFTPSGFTKLSDLYPTGKNPVVCRPFAQVINTMLQNGKLYGATTTPSLMQYDATLVSAVNDLSAAAISGSPAIHSYLRTAECRGATLPEKPLNRRLSNDISFFWLFVITCIVITCVWVILKIGGTENNGSTPIGAGLSGRRTSGKKR